MGESFPGPRDVWGASPSLKNTEKDVSDGFFLTSNIHKIKSIFGRGSAPNALNGPRTPIGELTMLPRPVVGC